MKFSVISCAEDVETLVSDLWTSLVQGPVSPALSPGVQPAAAGGSVYGVTPLSPSTPGLAGSYPLLSSAGQSITGVTEHKFPERPGEPECQYYLKTGNCKYGSSCKYHHPPDQGTSAACFLGPLGLPLRPVSFSLNLVHMCILFQIYNDY